MTTPHPHFRLRDLLLASALILSTLLSACAAHDLLTPARRGDDSADQSALRQFGTLVIGEPRVLAQPGGCTRAQPSDINDAGVVVGLAIMCPDGRGHGVRWDASGAWSFLPDLPGGTMTPFHVDERGTILAYLAVPERYEDAHERFFALAPGGDPVELPLPAPVDPGSYFRYVAGPNAKGTVLLKERLPDQSVRFHLWRGATGSTVVPAPAGQPHSLSNLDDHDQVVGVARIGGTWHAATWSRQRGWRALGTVDGAQDYTATVIDQQDRVYGSTFFSQPLACGNGAATPTRTTVWSRKGEPRLVTFPAPYDCGTIIPMGVSRAGLVVGTLGASVAPYGYGAVMTAEGSLAAAPCPNLGSSSFYACTAQAMNRAGLLAGTWGSPSDIRTVVWQVPLR